MRDVERKPIMLIVDDDAINRAILANIFEADYAIFEAENGAEAGGGSARTRTRSARCCWMW